MLTIPLIQVGTRTYNTIKQHKNVSYSSGGILLRSQRYSGSTCDTASRRGEIFPPITLLEAFCLFAPFSWFTFLVDFMTPSFASLSSCDLGVVLKVLPVKPDCRATEETKSNMLPDAIPELVSCSSLSGPRFLERPGLRRLATSPII